MDNAMIALADPRGPGDYEPLKMQVGCAGEALAAISPRSTQVTGLLLHVMPQNEVDPFLKMLCQGRYGAIPKRKPEASDSCGLGRKSDHLLSGTIRSAG